MKYRQSLLWSIPIITCLFLFVVPAFGQQIKEVKFAAKEPVLITSAGQSADTQMVKVLAERLKIGLKMNPLAGPEALSEVKSVIVVIGGSTKGMGAAGIDANKEAARIEQILSKAKEMKIPIIGMHIGGKARRGELSDRFIQLVVPNSSYLIVVKEGDSDELFSKNATSNRIPITLINKISEAQEPLKAIYGK